MRRLVLMALLVIATMGEQRGTVAYFSSTAAGTANTFTAGKVKLGISNNTGTVSTDTGLSSSGLITFAGIYPGASTYGEVTVQNSGNVSLRYAVQTQYSPDGGDANADGALAAALQLTVRLKDSTGTCDSTGFANYGTKLYPSSGDSAALAPADGSVSQLVGNTATGSHSGDQTLAPSATQNLCFRVTLLDTADSGLQNKSARIKLTFAAEQLSGT